MTLMSRIAPQLIALAALVALVSVFYPGFLSVEVQNDRLVGPVIDILKRSAPVALLAVGMIALFAIREDQPVFLDAAIALALVAFLGTVAYARFLLRGDIIE